MNSETKIETVQWHDASVELPDQNTPHDPDCICLLVLKKPVKTLRLTKTSVIVSIWESTTFHLMEMEMNAAEYEKQTGERIPIKELRGLSEKELMKRFPPDWSWNWAHDETMKIGGYLRAEDVRFWALMPKGP